MGDATKKLYILDGNYYIFRAYYGNQYLSTADGFPTGAIYAFTRMLQRLIAQERPHWMAVTFDIARASFRTALYPEYKANRAAPPEELVKQAPHIHDLVRAHNIPVMMHPDYEADDLIATLVKKARAAGMEVMIVSADKDLMQLLDEGTGMMDTMRDRVYRLADVEERFQVGPDRVADVLGLAGDTSDNIPGVPGIGEKTAGKLIAEFGSLEGLLSNIDKVSGKKRQENLREFAEQARISRELALLRTECEVELDVAALTVGEPDAAALEAFYQRFEFTTLLHELQQQRARPAPPPPVASAEKDYRPLLTSAALAEAVSAARQAPWVSVEAILAGEDVHGEPLVGVGLSWGSHQGCYVPFAHRYIGVPAQLTWEEARELLRPLLEDPSVPKVGHRIEHAWIALRRHGVALQGVKADVMLMAYLLDATRKTDDLDALASGTLGVTLKARKDVVGTGRKQVSFDMVDIDAATAWAAARVDAAGLLYAHLAPELAAAEKLQTLHDTLELPLALVLARMASHGLLVDVGQLKALSALYDRELVELAQQIFEEAGGEFNINSPSQLAKVLFEDLGLPVLKRTKTGPSTDQSVLEQLGEEHALPALITEYRSFAKLKSTYVDALPALVGADGRLHTEFNQAVAATGRLSSSNPNLQNIPVRTARGKEIRKAFAAPAGHLLLSADYSQVELRILAHFSGDPALVGAFRAGEDVHRRTAAEIFHVAPEAVTPQQRAVGKTINFGVIYGMGATRLARDLGITRRDADRYIAAYFERYGAVKSYFDGLVSSAEQLGYTTTLFGRRRAIPELTSGRQHLRAFGERTAINTPIQGTAADIIKLAMLEVQQRIDDEAWPAAMVLQVHDELIFEVQQNAADAFGALVARTMREVVQMEVPLVVDLNFGATWLDCK